MSNIRRIALMLMLVPCWLGWTPPLIAQGDDAVTVAMEKLASPDAAVRLTAVRDLAAMGPAAEAAYEALETVATGDADPAIRLVAAEALKKIRPAPEIPEELRALIHDLESQDTAVRTQAAMSLSLRGAKAQAAIPALTRAMKDEEKAVRRWAALALGKMAPESKSALAELGRVAESDADEQVRRNAKAAIEKIHAAAGAAATGEGGDPEVLRLMSALAGDQPMARMRAAMDLGQMGARAKAALPALTEASRTDTDTYARQAEADALAKIEKAVAGTGTTPDVRPDPDAGRLVGTWRGVIRKLNLTFVEVITFHPGDKVEAKITDLRGFIIWEGKGRYVYAKGILRTDFGEKLPQEQPVTWLTNDSYEISGGGVTATFERTE